MKGDVACKGGPPPALLAACRLQRAASVPCQPPCQAIGSASSVALPGLCPPSGRPGTRGKLLSPPGRPPLLTARQAAKLAARQAATLLATWQAFCQRQAQGPDEAHDAEARLQAGRCKGCQCEKCACVYH